MDGGLPPTAPENGDNDQNPRAQHVFLRHESEIGAMGGMQRFKTKVKSVCRRICCMHKAPVPGDSPESGDDSDLEEGSDGGRGKKKQYRLEAIRRTKIGLMHKLLCLWCCVSQTNSGGSVGITPNQALAMYLHWMFRINFFFLFALSCVVFFALTFFFAALIVAAGRLDPQCVRVGGQAFDVNGAAFADAFALSWTTFSTVGYGSTYPALGPENENPTNCLFITAICSLESFIGVLYSGFCGAILFGKVLRIQSHAQVIFSDPIVVRYGSGVESTEDLGKDDADDADEKKQIPCAVLEFRIVNRLFNDVGGEIMDATLNVVASVDANDVDPAVRDAADSDRQQFLRQRENSVNSSVTTISSDNGSDHGSTSLRDNLTRHNSLHFKVLDPISSFISSRRDHQAIDEDPSSRLVNKRIFSKMFIEASEHPFFKRVWVARHVLDESSPLLTPKARRAIRRAGGFWPEHLNSYEAVKDSLQFHQILVSLNGVSNVSASDVYAQKIYDAVDVNVGYQFVNLLYRDTDGSLKVDTDLINDVREQNGGGGEPLTL